MRIEKIDSGFLDTNFRFAQVLLENRFEFGLRVAKRIEKTESGFLDTPFVSLRATRKPFFRCSSNEVYREHRYNHSASSMMLCLINIVVYGNADL